MPVIETRNDDRYPTRVPAVAAADLKWVDREDPTVWARPGAGPIDADVWAEHARRGFTIVPRLLDAGEVAEFRTELEHLAQDPRLIDDHRVVRERSTRAVRSIFEVHRISERVAALARDPRLLDWARQLLGSDVYIHQSRVNYMPGFEGKGFYWHSDFETWHAEDGLPSPRAVSCSIALTENYPYNGALMVLPGSHRSFVPCVGETPDDNYRSSLVEQQIGVPSKTDVTQMTERYGIDQFTGPAGSAMWFDSNLMHGSGSNITPFPRSNIFLVFNSVENAPVAPYSASARRPSFIAAREATPL